MQVGPVGRRSAARAPSLPAARDSAAVPGTRRGPDRSRAGANPEHRPAHRAPTPPAGRAGAGDAASARTLIV